MSHLKFSKLFRSSLGSFVKNKTSYKFPLQQFNPAIFSYRKMSTMQVIHTDDAPQALGPYSQAIKANGFVFVSGQIPIVPADGSIPEDIVSQTNQVLKNLKQVLLAAGADLSSVVKTTVFLKDMNDFVAMNKVYEEHFGSHRPARAAIEVARLPKDVKVEIECVALAQ